MHNDAFLMGKNNLFWVSADFFVCTDEMHDITIKWRYFWWHWKTLPLRLLWVDWTLYHISICGFSTYTRLIIFMLRGHCYILHLSNMFKCLDKQETCLSLCICLVYNFYTTYKTIFVVNLQSAKYKLCSLKSYCSDKYL